MEATMLNPAFALRALKYRNYKLFFSGQLISLIGTWMQNIAQAWLVYRLTGSSLLLGLVSFAGQFPILLLSPVGGAVADRWNRRRIVIATQTASMLLAFGLSALTLTGWVRVWQVAVIASLLGVVNAFDIPTRQAFVVDMVGKSDLSSAIALNSSMFNAARIIGPAIAGVVVAAVGEGWCFFGNGVSYLAVIAGLSLIRVKANASAAEPPSMPRHIAEGFRYAARTAPIRAILLLLGTLSFMGMPYAVLMPIFADKILHGGARGLGLLMGASGIGAIIGALVLAARPNVRGLGRWIAYACAGFGASVILFSCSRNFWLSAALLVPAGFSMMVHMASSNTLVQTMVADEMRGRVMALYSMMFIGMAPLGALVAGAVADRLGAPSTVSAGGAACIAAAAVFRWKLGSFRAEARRLIAAQGAADSA
jgi:MFS family permease